MHKKQAMAKSACWKLYRCKFIAEFLYTIKQFVISMTTVENHGGEGCRGWGEEVADVKGDPPTLNPFLWRREFA